MPARLKPPVRLKPVVGVSTYREAAAWGVWRQTADLLPITYADQVRAAGAVAVLLPPGSTDVAADAAAAVDAVAGVVLSGGVDVDPARYGADRHVTTDPARPERDAWEIALVQASLAAGRPLLAVCRGLHVLNVALGGTLVQHLPDVVGHHDHRGQPGEFGRHRVCLAQASELAAVYGATADVATHHHQAVDRLADPLVATGWAADGTIEAVTCPGAAWVNGVQWHPEVVGGESLFRRFVQACADAS